MSAGQFLFYGCSFVPQTLQTDNGTLHALYRPLGFDIQLNNEPSQRIIFNW